MARLPELAELAELAEAILSGQVRGRVVMDVARSTAGQTGYLQVCRYAGVQVCSLTVSARLRTFLLWPAFGPSAEFAVFCYRKNSCWRKLRLGWRHFLTKTP